MNMAKGDGRTVCAWRIGMMPGLTAATASRKAASPKELRNGSPIVASSRDAGARASASSASSLIDDVIAAVDVERFARNEPRSVMRQEGGGETNIVDADQAASRRLAFCLFEQRV